MLKPLLQLLIFLQCFLLPAGAAYLDTLPKNQRDVFDYAMKTLDAEYPKTPPFVVSIRGF